MEISAENIFPSLKIQRRREYLFALGLLPMYFFAWGCYGARIWTVFLACLFSSFVSEIISRYLQDRAFFKFPWLFCLFFPLVLPPGIPLWMVALGTFFAQFFGGFFFGGHDRNLFCLVALGVVFLQLSYPFRYCEFWAIPFGELEQGFLSYETLKKAPAPIAIKIAREANSSLEELFFRKASGTFGEAVPIYSWVFLFLALSLRIADFRLILPSILGIALFSSIGSMIFPNKIFASIHQFFVGPIALGLLVLSADSFSLPRTPEGRFAGGLVFAFFLVIIRSFSVVSEAVFFAILLMNTFSPLIDQLVVRWVYKVAES